MSDALDDTFVPFVTLLREGTFRDPGDEWSAEFIGAHIAQATEHMAKVAQGALDGVAVTFDNREDVDPETLRGYVESHGERLGVANAVEAAARRFADVASSLSDEQRGSPIDVTLVDNGAVVFDQTSTLGVILTIHVTNHLGAHYEQLRALIDE